ncbi:MAG: DNA repair protein RecO [Fodinibius sp.]|nr:DNA repair protein RecO [Fodinibius sp.]
MITHTEAIIFRSVDYQESSKIVTMFTREHGKIALMVRGVKKPKSKFSGLIEIGNVLDVVYYYKSSRSVQILSEASYAEKNYKLRTQFEKMATMTSAVELISQLLHDEENKRAAF